MNNSPESQNQDAKPTAVIESRPVISSELLAEAKKSVDNGTATDEQKVLVEGYKAGAIATDKAIEGHSPANTDLMAMTQRRIERQQDDIATAAMWGHDTSKQRQELQGDLDMKGYLDTRDYKDENGKIIPGQPKPPEPTAGTEPEPLEPVAEKLYENTPIDDLLKAWADAEDNKDKTTSTNIQNELQDRLLKQTNMSEDYKVHLIDVLHSEMMKKRQVPKPTETEPEIKAADKAEASEKQVPGFAKQPQKSEETVESSEPTPATKGTDEQHDPHGLVEASWKLLNPEPAADKQTAVEQDKSQPIGIEQIDKIENQEVPEVDPLKPRPEKEATSVTSPAESTLQTVAEQPQEQIEAATPEAEPAPAAPESDANEKDISAETSPETEEQPADSVAEKNEAEQPQSMTDVEPDNSQPETSADEKDEQLRFTAAIGKNSLAELVHTAMEIADKDQRERASGIRGILQKVAGAIKYSSLFKQETQRKRSEELMFKALNKMEETGKSSLTLEQWREVLNNEGITFTSDQETAFLTSISEHLFTESEGFAMHGKGGEDEPQEITALRSNLKRTVLDFVVAEGAEGLSDEDRANLFKQYTNDISIHVNSFMNFNPSFKKEDIEVYADNAKQLLERSLATYRHDDGKDRLDALLNGMRIDVGQRQLGAYNNLNTEHVERTLALAKTHRIGTVIGKTSFVVSTWVGAGALSSGLATWSAQSVSSRGVKIAGLTVGSLAGPTGAVAGMAAGAGLAAAWGRLLGRRRASENADLAATSIAYSGDRQANEQFSKLSPDAILYKAANDTLGQFIEQKQGANPESTDLNDITFRSDLTNEELLQAADVVASLQAKVDVEDEYNRNSQIFAEQERNRSKFAKMFQSQSDQDSRALNLFIAENKFTHDQERGQMIKKLRVVGQGLVDKYSQTQIEIPSGETSGDKISVPLEKYLSSSLVEQRLAAIQQYEDYQDRVQAEINKAGRKGAAIGGLAFGIFAGANELITNSNADSLSNIFGNQKAGGENLMAPLPGSSVKGVNTEILSAQNFGKSGVEIKGNQAIFTNYQGEQISAALDSNGQLSAADITNLKTKGIEVSQVVNYGTRGTMGADEALQQMGGKKLSITEWLDIGTVNPNGTELGANINKLPDGTIELTQSGGIASGDGVSVDIMNAAKSGKVFARVMSGDTAITIPGTVQGDAVVATIKPGDAAYSLFSDGEHPKVLTDNWGWSYGDANGENSISISTVLGEGNENISTVIPPSTKINIENIVIPENSPAAPEGNAIFTGPAVPPETQSILGARQTENNPSRDTEQPSVPEPETAPNPAPAPTPSPSPAPSQQSSAERRVEATSTPIIAPSADGQPIPTLNVVRIEPNGNYKVLMGDGEIATYPNLSMKELLAKKKVRLNMLSQQKNAA